MYIQVKHLIHMSIESDLGMDCGLNRRRMVIAHEILHLIRFEENSALRIHPNRPQYYPLAIALVSLFEDPIIDSILKNKYDFDLRILYEEIMDDVKRHSTIKEPTDNLRRIITGFILAIDILRWNLITDQKARRNWIAHLKWYEDQYPNIYKIGADTVAIVTDIG
jgi:hypothetical protein